MKTKVSFLLLCAMSLLAAVHAEPAGRPSEPKLVHKLSDRHRAPLTNILSFDEPVYAGLPVWVHVKLPAGEPYDLIQSNIRYPFTEKPACFGLAFSFEVMRDGKLLPKPDLLSTCGGAWNGPFMGSSAPPRSPTGRFPLHLQYHFDGPGNYLVRFLVADGFGTQRPPTVESDWTPLRVQPSTAEQRRQWVARMKTNAPTDPGILVGDYLPSLLVSPTDDVLPVFAQHAQDPNSQVSACVMECFPCFTAEAQRREVLHLLRTRKLNIEIVAYLGSARSVLQPVVSELVDIVLPYLKSESGHELDLAFRALGTLRSYSLAGHPQVPAKIDEATQNAIPHIMSFHTSEPLKPFVEAIGAVKSDQHREWLWQLSTNQSVRGEALNYLAMQGDRRDLNRLGDILLEPQGQDINLSYQLRRAYGVDSIPVLLRALRESGNTRVRFGCAEELAFEGRPEAFAYLGELLRTDKQYRQSITQLLQDHFKLPNRSSDADILKFLDARAKNPEKKEPQ